MVSPVILKKEDIRIPDYYTVKIHPVNGTEPIEYKVTEHSYIKSPKRYLMDNQGRILLNPEHKPIVAEWESLRAIEIKLFGQGNRKRIVIGLDQCIIEFGHDFDVFIELKAEKDRIEAEKRAKKENLVNIQDHANKK